MAGRGPSMWEDGRCGPNQGNTAGESRERVAHGGQVRGAHAGGRRHEEREYYVRMRDAWIGLATRCRFFDLPDGAGSRDRVADHGSTAFPRSGNESLTRLQGTAMHSLSRCPAFRSAPGPCEQPCAGCRSAPDPDRSSRSRAARRLHQQTRWGRWQPVPVGVGDGNAALS